MTKRYLVAFANLATVPLGDSPPAGAATDEFDDFALAREFADNVKGKWSWVAIYDRTRAARLTPG
ncbi:MAG: hypothetical protein ACYDIE_08795, partial [Candidatus Krumholzibacteriia bacterium]